MEKLRQLYHTDNLIWYERVCTAWGLKPKCSGPSYPTLKGGVITNQPNNISHINNPSL